MVSWIPSIRHFKKSKEEKGFKFISFSVAVIFKYDLCHTFYESFEFQAVRNLDDLECMAVPNKYKKIMTFYKYYKGIERAPYPTLFS